MNRIVAIFLCMACANAPAFELKLSAEEQAACANEGGCIVVSRKLISDAVHQAYDAGRATCGVKL